jgi:hypothetical protein
MNYHLETPGKSASMMESCLPVRPLRARQVARFWMLPHVEQDMDRGAFSVSLAVKDLVTTPNCRVPTLSTLEHGFPLWSGARHSIIRDAIVAGAALVTMKA